MSLARRIAGGVTRYARVVLVVMVISTAVVGAGVTGIEDDTSLEQFTGDSPEVRADEYVDANFTAPGEENTTRALVVRTGENVLTRESLLATLRLQREIRENDSINATLIEDEPITGLANVIAIGANRSERIDALEARADALEARADRINASMERLEAGLDRIRALQRGFENDTAGMDENSTAYRERKARLETEVDAVIRRATTVLDDSDTRSYRAFSDAIRRYVSDLVALEREYGENASERGVYRERREDIELQYAGAIDDRFQQAFFQLVESQRKLENDFEAVADADRPTLGEQIAALNDPGFNDTEFEDVVTETLDGDGPSGDDVLGLVAASYEPNTTTASARMTVLTQRTNGSEGLEMGVTDPTVIESQQDLRAFVAAYGTRQDGDGNGGAGDANATGAGADATGEYVVFGSGLIEEEIDRSMGDSLWIVGPLALLFVVLALAVAYRDPLDILLGVAGIAVVLVWTFGLLGWSGLSFNALFVAIPVLLIGISIDFAVHVFMRHREHRAAGDDGVHDAMTVALAGVGVALFWAAATTIIGFLANVVSPLGVIREFGIVSGFGIGAALLVFGAFVPAAKVELDALLESFGIDRRKRAFGTGGGPVSRALSVGAVAARRAPAVLLLLVLVVTAGGVYGAVQVDTTFEQEDFVARSPPDWTYSLPGPMAPGEYRAAAELDVVNEHFRPADARAQVLVRGDVATTEMLRRLSTARADAASRETVYTLPNGEADVEGPLSTMRDVAARNDSFNETFLDADVDNDTIPEKNASGLYDALFRADADAASEVIHRTDDGEYAAVRMIIGVEGDASYAETTAAMREVAAGIEDGGGGMVAAGDRDGTPTPGDGAVTSTTTGGGEPTATIGDGIVVIGGNGTPGPDGENGSVGSADDGPPTLRAIATGSPVVNRIVEQSLFETLVESLIATFVAVFVFLTIGYRLAGHGATLGAVTLLPVTLSVAWILGTMYLLGIPFNVLTVMITSLTIGLGVSYSIHVSARYRLELTRQDNAWTAMERTVRGTGGALLGSAATTTSAFGTLAFAILPVLGQFGAITGVTIIYAWIASVIVLPTLLAFWTRYWGPDVSLDPPGTAEGTAVASDGGRGGGE